MRDLVESKLVSPEAIRNVIEFRREHETDLLDAIEKLGIVDKSQRPSLLAQQLGLPFVHIENLTVDPAIVALARDVFHRIEDSSAEAETLNNIGQLYLQLDQADQALQYLNNSFQTAQLFELNSESAEAKSSAIELQANVLDNLCRTYLQLSETDKALGSGLLSVQLFQQLRRQAETTKLADLQRGEARALNQFGLVIPAH